MDKRKPGQKAKFQGQEYCSLCPLQGKLNRKKKLSCICIKLPNSLGLQSSLVQPLTAEQTWLWSGPWTAKFQTFQRNHCHSEYLFQMLTDPSMTFPTAIQLEFFLLQFTLVFFHPFSMQLKSGFIFSITSHYMIVGNNMISAKTNKPCLSASPHKSFASVPQLSYLDGPLLNLIQYSSVFIVQGSLEQFSRYNLTSAKQ